MHSVGDTYSIDYTYTTYMCLNVDNIPVSVYHDDVFNPKLAWYKANQDDINIYKQKIAKSVSVLSVPACI